MTVIAPIAADGTVTFAATTAADVIVDVTAYIAPPRWTYGYDGNGLRSARTGPNASLTTFTWDRSDTIPKLISQQTGSARTYIIYGPGGHPFAQVNADDTDLVYYHRDQIGSTRAVTDSTGALVGTFSYDAYGKQTAATGTATPLLGYTGEYTDTETGYTYLRARHYDPTTGQFLTRDPIEAITADPYGYAATNPISYVDPTGYAPSQNDQGPPSSQEYLQEQNKPDWVVSGHRLPRRGVDRSYVPPKTGHGKPVKVSGERYGWIDCDDNIWEWAKDQHAGPHWDVQHPDGSRTNVTEDGVVTHGDDNFYKDVPLTGWKAWALGSAIAVVVVVVVAVAGPPVAAGSVLGGAALGGAALAGA